MEEKDGLTIARERIAQEAKDQTGILDLRDLELKVLPEELCELKHLRSLNCTRTHVQDLTPLAALTALQKLDCSWTRVQDLTPLAALTALQSLRCNNCNLSRIPKDFWFKASLESVYLHETKIPGIPAEVMSKDWNVNCLASLRAHLTDLNAGASELHDVKLMVLGNGRVGKTQICRRLRGENYDVEVSSTHGISVSTAPLPDTDKSLSALLHIWDFGGQDIYHGTHALFMRTRSIFLLVWASEIENSDTYAHDGMLFRNHPLTYWLASVRHFGGAENPVLLTQTRCDRPEDDARKLPVPDDAVHGFKFCTTLLHYSALNNRGRAALEEALRDAVSWLREHQGISTVGSGRLRVQRRLEALRDADRNIAPEQRRYRTLTQEHFRQICEEEGGVSSPDFLLEYLHNTGLVFYRQGLFHNRIILDQGWALDAVYAVFHREKSYKQLRWGKGRFTRSLLQLLVWEEYTKEEQELFLSMMESCGICFVHRKGDAKGETETEYIAPELLPERAEIAGELEEKWDSRAPKEEAVFEYELLHPGLLAGLVARIGGAAGINGIYWKDGVCVWEKTTRSYALIEQESRDDWRGVIRLQTQSGAAATLLERLRTLINEEQAKYGIRSRELPGEEQAHMQSRNVRAVEKPVDAAKLEFGQEPVSGAEYCVSYAWGDHSPEGRKREEIVDKLCAAAETRSIRILRDKNALGLGERISKFMQRIGRADRIFVILSDKYLKSPYCMFELFEIWRNSRGEEELFLQRVRVYTLPCAKVFSLREQIEYAIYWKDQFNKIEELVKEHGVAILGLEQFKQFPRGKEF